MKLSGRCLCGKCTWKSNAEPNWVCTCHCESCRLNCAAPFTSFTGIDNGHWQWTGTPPSSYTSTPGVTRYFCADCGTPMAYRNEKWDHEIHFYLASLDSKHQLQPQFHVHWNERVLWADINDDLPKYAGSADNSEPLG